MSSRAKFVNEIEVVDPDSHNVVNVAVFKHENGGMFAIDSSFVEQVLGDDEIMSPSIYDPFVNMGEDPGELYLEGT